MSTGVRFPELAGAGGERRRRRFFYSIIDWLACIRRTRCTHNMLLWSTVGTANGVNGGLWQWLARCAQGRRDPSILALHSRRLPITAAVRCRAQRHRLVPEDGDLLSELHRCHPFRPHICPYGVLSKLPLVGPELAGSRGSRRARMPMGSWTRLLADKLARQAL